MTVAEALAFFEGERTVERSLQPLADVGLDYVQLGQAVPTLSGGEAQRLKLAGHLVATGTAKQHEHTLFLFDEPTTGLHFSDIAQDRKSTRLNSSHVAISYAVFCLKKK